MCPRRHRFKSKPLDPQDVAGIERDTHSCASEHLRLVNLGALRRSLEHEGGLQGTLLYRDNDVAVFREHLLRRARKGINLEREPGPAIVEVREAPPAGIIDSKDKLVSATHSYGSFVSDWKLDPILSAVAAQERPDCPRFPRDARDLWEEAEPLNTNLRASPRGALDDADGVETDEVVRHIEDVLVELAQRPLRGLQEVTGSL